MHAVVALEIQFYWTQSCLQADWPGCEQSIRNKTYDCPPRTHEKLQRSPSLCKNWFPLVLVQVLNKLGKTSAQQAYSRVFPCCWLVSNPPEDVLECHIYLISCKSPKRQAHGLGQGWQLCQNRALAVCVCVPFCIISQSWILSLDVFWPWSWIWRVLSGDQLNALSPEGDERGQEGWYLRCGLVAGTLLKGTGMPGNLSLSPSSLLLLGPRLGAGWLCCSSVFHLKHWALQSPDQSLLCLKCLEDKTNQLNRFPSLAVIIPAVLTSSLLTLLIMFAIELFSCLPGPTRAQKHQVFSCTSVCRHVSSTVMNLCGEAWGLQSNSTWLWAESFP